MYIAWHLWEVATNVPKHICNIKNECCYYIEINMPQSFKNAQDLHTYLTDNPLYKNQILASIPIELKKEYKKYQSKLRQQRYRKANKELANERSRIKMSTNRSNNPEKYKQMNSEHNKTYRNKNKSDFQTAFDKIVQDISTGLKKKHI